MFVLASKGPNVLETWYIHVPWLLADEVFNSESFPDLSDVQDDEPKAEERETAAVSTKCLGPLHILRECWKSQQGKHHELRRSWSPGKSIQKIFKNHLLNRGVFSKTSFFEGCALLGRSWSTKNPAGAEFRGPGMVRAPSSPAQNLRISLVGFLLWFCRGFLWWLLMAFQWFSRVFPGFFNGFLGFSWLFDDFLELFIAFQWFSRVCMGLCFHKINYLGGRTRYPVSELTMCFLLLGFISWSHQLAILGWLTWLKGPAFSLSWRSWTKRVSFVGGPDVQRGRWPLLGDWKRDKRLWTWGAGSILPILNLLGSGWYSKFSSENSSHFKPFEAFVRGRPARALSLLADNFFASLLPCAGAAYCGFGL